ncbi:sensor histidine kinase [Pseudonocardia adelaidensis]|uniref:sensor histidine kinase n=1 Tax=Pseudonocardia adelaidensis TaxID=648754 RepID=UPI0031E58D08
MTSTETRQSWSERLNPRNWTLTVKLVVVGIVPALLALVLGVLRVSDQAGAAAELGRSTQLLDVQQRVTSTAGVLRQERDEATLYVAGGRAGDRGVLEIGFNQSEAEAEEMLTALEGADGLEPTTVAAVAQAKGQIGQLQNLRADVTDNPGIGASQILSRYGEVVASLDVLDRALLRQLRTPEVSGLSDALTAATGAAEQLAVQHTILGAGIRAGSLQPGDANAVVATDDRLRSEFAEYQVSLTPQQLIRFGNFLDDAANAQRERLKATILATPPDQPISVPSYEWDTAYNGSRAAVDRSADLLRNELVSTSQASEEQASNLAGVNAVILMLGLLAGIAVAVLLARALIRSLRVLRSSALDVAERRLPDAVERMRAGHTPDVAVDPVPLVGRDEVGQVARAFDAVHGQAVRLAAEQAALQAGVSAMFVNLSRRSQALVERQLQLIEQLESNEQDADQLANLFQLDHLATRMRRNSENLLVLAGTDLAKRNIAPVPVVDVLRAAVSEVESYQRIVVQTPPTATVAGRAASDVVHLLAELLDNATNFSPPDSQVVMSTARAGDGSIIVEIADRGVGMAEHELADANQRLGGPSSVDVSASRRMGLFVVGRLATRHGINVRLTSSAGGGSGLTASVTVPAHLIPSIEPVEVSRTAGLPLVTGAGRPTVPPQRGVNGAARSGGLSALIAGTDGTANPTNVFDAPLGGDGQLFTPPSGPAGTPPPALPSRRPGSSLRPGGPPEPPEGGDRSEHRGVDPAEEEAREVAAQARRDQEAAARAAAARAEESAGTRSEQPGAEARNGRAVGFAGGQDQKGAEQQDPDQQHPDQQGTGGEGDAQAAPYSNGRIVPPATASGLPRRTPGRPGMPKPAAEQAPSQEAAAEQSPAQSATGQPESRSELSPRQAEPAQQEPEQEQPSGREQHADDAAAAVSPPTMPMPAVRRTRGEATQHPATQHPATQHPATQHPATQHPATQHPATQQPDAEPAEPQQAAAERPETRQAPAEPAQQAAQEQAAQEPDAPQPAARAQAPQPAPRPTPRPTPRPFSTAGAAPASEQAPAGGRAEQAASDADTLFAPSVPVISEPGTGLGLGSRPSTGFDLGETTPIFEEIASAWFRSNRPVPVDYETERSNGTAKPKPGPATPPQAPPAAAAPQPTSPPQPQPQPTQQPAPQRMPRRAPSPRPSPAPVSPPTAEIPITPQPQPQPEPQPQAAPAPAEQEFASMADEGWRAASAVTQREDELTAAGLPKRRPRARLVPGSAGSSVLAAPAGSTRSAESIRGRLASYQQGVRQGRESRGRGAQQHNGGTGPANAGGNHDEESS